MKSKGRSQTWTCVCNYMNMGPICTHCGTLREHATQFVAQAPTGRYQSASVSTGGQTVTLRCDLCLSRLLEVPALDDMRVSDINDAVGAHVCPTDAARKVQR